MSSIAQILRDRVARISRKETNAIVTRIRKPVSVLKITVAALKNRVVALEKENKQIQERLRKAQAMIPAPTPEEATGAPLTTRNIKSLRRKLRLSQENLAKLVGVTAQSVYLWERKRGALKLRKETLAAILAVRDLTATEAKEKLAKSQKSKKPARKRAKK